MERREVGQSGEETASSYLEKFGYQILDRNFQNQKGRRLGEIDIIAFDRNENILVFVEVKTRKAKNRFGAPPEQNITRNKLRKLEKIAQAYVKKERLESQNYRFDAISVLIGEDGEASEIRHLKSIFL